ncbi:MAG: coproporphyrinogen dehydrogenase HemZ [Clostridia bacterium]
MEVNTNYLPLEIDLQALVKQYEFNDVKVVKLDHFLKMGDNKVTNFCVLCADEKITEECMSTKLPQFSSLLEEKRFLKREAKLCVYKLLSKYFNCGLPWGSLTGVHPTKLGYQLIKEGVEPNMIKNTLINNFYVSAEKAELVEKVIKSQEALIVKNDGVIDLFVNIPFCPSRCNYCSSVSNVVSESGDLVEKYLQALKKEFDVVKKIIKEKPYIVRSIYVGGGTPSVLTNFQIEELLMMFPYQVEEFTFECGRPETITAEKLAVLKKYGVNRICINPQTFNEKTLNKIHRTHTVKDVYSALKVAMPFQFKINMDFIAGLAGETLSDFKRTIDLVLEILPDNITIHALALKRGSDLAKDEEQKNDTKKENLVKKMIEYSITELMEEEYKPYYLYRLKYQNGQENIGWTKPNSACKFNIDSMEETVSIMAIGANAISKRVWNVKNKIERSANVKDVAEYIARIEEMLERKKKLFM